MAGAQYLYRRDSGIYFVRLCVPARLKAAVGKGEVHRTTRCRDYRLAKIVSCEIAAQWHEALRRLEHMDPSKIVAGSLDLLGEGYMPLAHAADVLGADQTRLAADLIAKGAPLFVEAKDWDGWLIEDVELLEHVRDEAGLAEVVIDEQTLQRHGSRRRLSQTLAIRFSAEALACIRSEGGAEEICQFLLWPSRDRAFVLALPGRRVSQLELLVRKADVEGLRGWLAAQTTPEMLEDSRRRMSRATADDAGQMVCFAKHADMKLSALVAEYVAQRRATWKPNTLHTNADRCGALVELTGDPHLREVERTMLMAWARRVAALPDNRQRIRLKPGNAEKTFAQLIEIADGGGLKRLTPAAVEKMADGASEFFKWAHEQRYFKENPALGLGRDIRNVVSPRAKSGRPSDERLLFSNSELNRIFAATWFRDGVGARTKEGKFYQYRPHYYWLPLLALFTGGRINELSQLYLADLRFGPDVVAHVDFNLEGEGKITSDEGDGQLAVGTTDKSLKTVSAERKVPLHASLLDLGLEEYVEALRAAGHRRLFPELSHDRVKGYGKAAGKWFNDSFLGRQLKIKRDGKKTFHSLRHHYATALGKAGTPDSIKVRLMGHSATRDLVNQRYDKGPQLDQLAPHLQKLEHATPPIARFDVEAGMQAVRDALDLKNAHGIASRTT